jgi:probable rRNA maturation factor
MASAARPIQIATRIRGVPGAARFRRWLSATLPAEAQVTLRVVNSAEARVLNRDFRGRDYATNVLTFAYGGTPLSADIVLCAQVVAREAREQGKTVADHYAHLTVHGALHALGFDHERARDAARMESREVEILGTLKIDNPYESATAIDSKKTKARRVTAA